jgi:phospholipase/carboxylesterase
MIPGSVVVQQAVSRPEQLILMFHGMGGTAEGLVPLGRVLAAAFPASTVVSVAAPNPSGTMGGREWFPIGGITEENRVERVAAAMPAFLAEVRAWQQAADVTATATALVGFSQGAIMALEASATPESPAGRIVAMAGRYAKLPEHAPSHTTIHMISGKEDPVIHYRHAIEAAHRLRGLGGDVTADVIPFVGHTITDDMAALAVERLRGHVPKRMWEEAMRAAAKLQPGSDP